MKQNTKNVDDCSRNRRNDEGTLFKRDLHETPIEAVKKATSLKQTGSPAFPMVNEAHQLFQNNNKTTNNASQMQATGVSPSLRKKRTILENRLYFHKRKLLLANGAVAHDKCPSINRFSHDLNNLMVEYIITHFTLYELYVIFLQYQNCFGMEKCVIQEAKRSAIMSIDSEKLSPRQSKRLKKIVWDMSPIQFGLILNYVMPSSLFWDARAEKFLRPEFNLSR